MGKKATVNRLLWDLGWHGSDRAKTATPTAGTTEDEWIGCKDCGHVD